MGPNYIGVTTLTFLGHVTSSFTWPIDPPYAISYWCPIGKWPLSLTVFEIYGPITRARAHTHTDTRCKWFYYPRDAMLARVIAIATCLSVRLSVRHAPVLCQNEEMISSSSGSPKTLVFRRQISSPNSKGFPRTGASKKGRSEKTQRFFSFKRQYLENGGRYGQSYY